MGEIDKPWNCPHGRPTMRHLCELGAWDRLGWKEGDFVDGEREVIVRGMGTDWEEFVQNSGERKRDVDSEEDKESSSETRDEMEEEGSFVDMGDGYAE